MGPDKEAYETPVTEIIFFETEDVITTSSIAYDLGEDEFPIMR